MLGEILLQRCTNKTKSPFRRRPKQTGKPASSNNEDKVDITQSLIIIKYIVIRGLQWDRDIEYWKKGFVLAECFCLCCSDLVKQMGGEKVECKARLVCLQGEASHHPVRLISSSSGDRSGRQQSNCDDRLGASWPEWPGWPD